MRGHGAVNSRCAVEVGIDDLSEQLQVDPISFRLANLLQQLLDSELQV